MDQDDRQAVFEAMMIGASVMIAALLAAATIGAAWRIFSTIGGV